MGEFTKVEIKNLKPLAASLKRIDAESAKGLQVALKGVAGLVVKKVIPQIPRKKGAAANSVKASATKTSAKITFGGTKAPYYPWLDFGGRVGRKKSVVRTFYKQGRYIYPTLEREQENITKALEDALSGVIRSAGLQEG